MPSLAIPEIGQTLFCAGPVTDRITEPDGTVMAVIAHINTVNHKSLLYLPDSIGDQTAIVSDWNHSAVINGRPPIALGTISEQKNGEVIATVKYNLDSPTGLCAYQIAKEYPVLEYSISVVPLARPELKTNDDGDTWVEFSSLRTPEFSPVVSGADPDTRTLEVNRHWHIPMPEVTAEPAPEVGPELPNLNDLVGYGRFKQRAGV